MSTVASYNANDPYEQLISQMIAIERQPQLKLKAQKGDQNVFKGVLSDFDSAVSALNTSLEGLMDLVSNPFAARKATVPKDAGFSVSVTEDAVPGSHSLAVERLATTDTRVSQRLDAAGTSLRSFFDTNGAQTFEIEVFSPTSDEPERRVPIAVTVDPSGATDGEILDEIRTAIGGAMDTAVEAETIGREAVASASVVSETSDTARLTLRSGGTGFDNRLAFTDSANGLLSLLELNNAALADTSGTGGGQITAVGTDDQTSELNARFQLNGLTLYRSSNEVSDALDGITLSLSSVDEATSFSVGADNGAIAGDIEGFITKYNAVLDFIEKKTKIDPETETRGAFAGDTSVRSLRFGMRTDLMQSVAGQPDGLARLTDLGIEVEDNGKLKLADKSALQAAVERDPQAVQNLFAAEDGGLGTRLVERLDIFLGSDGIISQRKKSADARIKRFDDQIERWDTRLAKREDQLRLQYAKFQETIAILQGQSSALSSLLYSSYGY